MQELDQARVKRFLRAKDCHLIHLNMNVSAHSIWVEFGKGWSSQSDQSSRFYCKNRAPNKTMKCYALWWQKLERHQQPPTYCGEPVRLSFTRTPNHLLTLKSQVALPPPPGSFEQLDLYSRKRWRRVRYLANQLWIRWRREYFSLLHKRQKWNVPQRDSREGDIVLLLDDTLPENQWPLAQVTKVFPSKDGFVR